MSSKRQRSQRTFAKLSVVEPESQLEAEARIVKLTSDIADLDQQLRNPLPDSQRTPEYNAWRTRAEAAKQAKSEERRLLKVWIQRQIERARAEAGLTGRKERLQAAISTLSTHERLSRDLTHIGAQLRRATNAWGTMLGVVQAADEYERAERDLATSDETVDTFLEQLRAALEIARLRGYLPSSEGAWKASGDEGAKVEPSSEL